MTGWIGPLALCRLDEDLVSRIRRRDDLGRLLIEAALWMVLGAAVYGVVFGLWRSPLQAVYAGLKLPLLLAVLMLTTTAANAVFAKLVGTELDLQQSACCSLLGMAILAVILASVSPVSLLFVTQVESHGESLVGVFGPEAARALQQAQWLLATHVVVIGVAGLIALGKLRNLLTVLAGSRELGLRLFWIWLAVQALAGTQLSWILRPYLGKPGLEVQLLRPDAFQGSFIEEVARWISR